MSRWGRQEDRTILLLGRSSQKERKSKGLHLHGNEDWDWAQDATKSCGCDVRLPTADDQHCSTPSTRGRLCQIRASPVAKQVERHHFLCLLFAARNSPSFRIFDFSILDPPTGHPSTSTHPFIIRTFIVAHHTRSKAPRHVFTRDFLRRRRYIAAARIWTFRERKLGKKRYM